MQTNLYPKGPSNVPADLTLPGKTYKKHVWIASLGLMLFVLLYLGLSGWFLYKSYKLFANTFSGNKDGFLSFMAAAITGFLGIFMIKALFFITKRDKSDAVEITKEEEPALFEFIYKVADDANAPRPHKVFVSNIVNACVFYDISFINLFFPTRKNLEIGLGLVNTLNLGEFKSILAHEFGHFAQRSMIIGRWVYISHKVAYQIVAKRDGFDGFLRGLSGLDLRIAWIGWILSIIVWSIRAVSETFFKLVIITERALSREMEFQADLVAVSLTGSDELIHSLYKLHAADEAYDEAINFVNKQLKKKKAVTDIYAIQESSIKHMALALNNPAYGAVPKPKDVDGAKFKVFKEQLAQAPKMWSTHPSNIDREKNAKAHYIKSEPDNRSCWLLFKDPDAIKSKLTQTLYKNLKIETTPLSKQESVELHDKEFQRSFLLPKYRGVYLNRRVTLAYASVKEMYNASVSTENLAAQFEALYPPHIQQQLEHLKNLGEELEMLEGIQNKVLDVNEGKINYRDREISRNELPEIIAQVKEEVKIAEGKVNEHDKLCRSLHDAAAKKVGNGWPEYMWSLASLVHYCEHSQKKIEELGKYYYDTLSVATQIRNISSSELKPLLDAATDLHSVIAAIFERSKTIIVSGRLLEKMDGQQYAELLEPFQLNRPVENNINSWIGVVESWMNLAFNSLTTLKEAALDELLYTEEYIENTFKNSIVPEQAPAVIPVPEGYTTYDPAFKKEVTQKPDFLSRFYNADGMLPTIARLAASAAIILFVVLFSANIGQSNLIIYNGMPVDVIVNAGGRDIDVNSGKSIEVTIDDSGNMDIETTTTDGKAIEKFTVDVSPDSKTYVYNVAQAAVLYQWIAYYSEYGGSNMQDNSSLLGSPRWRDIYVDHYFEEPPQSVSVSRGGSATRTILSAYTDHPTQMYAAIQDNEERNAFTRNHALWVNSNSPDVLIWLSLAMELKDFPDIVKKRLEANPLDVPALRMMQDYYQGADKAALCEKQNSLYAKNPDNPDLYYLKVRCMEDSPEQDRAFIDGSQKWPDNQWLAYAAAYNYVLEEQWEKAAAKYEVIVKNGSALKNLVTEDMKRLGRLLQTDELTSLSDEEKQPYLRYVNAVENSRENDSQPGLYAYKLLAEGKLSEALENSKADSSIYEVVLRLAAVSDGADNDIIEKAAALSTYDLGKVSIIPALALAVRKDLSLDNFKESIKTQFKDEKEVLEFITDIKLNKIAEADKLLQKMTTEMKAKMALLGTLIVKGPLPKKWNALASGLLFINEKPYRVNELKTWTLADLK